MNTAIYDKEDKLRAIHYPDRKLHKQQKIKGSFWLPMEEPKPGDVQGFWFVCPCGCNALYRVPVGMQFKPDIGWRWNGKYDGITVSPAIEVTGHLKASLTDGYWEIH